MNTADMKPHQLRVLDERDDLQGKIERLDIFTGSEMFRTLPATEQFTMVNQLNFMRGYLQCLDKRILAFT